MTVFAEKLYNSPGIYIKVYKQRGKSEIQIVVYVTLLMMCRTWQTSPPTTHAHIKECANDEAKATVENICNAGYSLFFSFPMYTEHFMVL